MTNPAPRSTGPTRNASLLARPAEADYDLRLVCNAVKRSAALTSATLATGSDAAMLVDAAERMTQSLLDLAGVEKRKRVDGHGSYAMAMEASALTLEALASTKRGAALLSADIDGAAKDANKLFATLVSSKPVARIADAAWSGDIKGATGLRLALCTAMAPLSVTLAEYSFEQPPAACIREAAKLVAKVAIGAADAIAPDEASPSARAVLQQSLVASCSKILLAIWRRETEVTVARLRSMGAKERAEERLRMSEAGVAEVIGRVSPRLEAAFAAVVDSSLDLVPDLGEEAPAPEAPAVSAKSKVGHVAPEPSRVPMASVDQRTWQRAWRRHV